MFYLRAVVEMRCCLHPITGDLNQQHSHNLHVLHIAVLGGVFTVCFLCETGHTYELADVYCRQYIEVEYSNF